MKKILLLLAISGALLMASCTKQYNQVVPNQTALYNLPSTGWATTDTSKNYTISLTSPEIDDFFTANGAVVIYLSFDGGTTYEQVPEVYNNVSFTYTYTAGGIVLYAQSSTGTTAISPPIDCIAKVVLIPSQQ